MEVGIGRYILRSILFPGSSLRNESTLNVPVSSTLNRASSDARFFYDVVWVPKKVQVHSSIVQLNKKVPMKNKLKN